MSDSVLPSPRADYRAGTEDLGMPSVEVVRHSARIAVVSLVGEHDLSTKDRMLDALASAASQPCVVVDLSRCTFVDSSFIGVLVALYGTDICTVQARRARTQRVVWRTLELVQMDRFFAIHDSLEQALLAAAAADVLPVRPRRWRRERRRPRGRPGRRRHLARARAGRQARECSRGHTRGGGGASPEHPPQPRRRRVARLRSRRLGDGRSRRARTRVALGERLADLPIAAGVVRHRLSVRGSLESPRARRFVRRSRVRHADRRRARCDRLERARLPRRRHARGRCRVRPRRRADARDRPAGCAARTGARGCLAVPRREPGRGLATSSSARRSAAWRARRPAASRARSCSSARLRAASSRPSTWRDASRCSTGAATSSSGRR